MSTTVLSNLINPQVMGDMISAKIPALLKFKGYAHVDNTLSGVAGDTKTVPSWGFIGNASDYDVEGGAGIDTTNLTATSTTFTIKCAAKGVSIYQTAINSGMGDPVGQAESQLSKAMAGKMDDDVLDTIYEGNVTSSDGTSVISYTNIVGAVTKFEDESDGTDKVMFIHPIQEGTLLVDPNFLSADKFESGVAVNGSIGKIAGCWIKKSKKVRLVTHVKDNASGTITLDSSNLAEYQVKCDPTVKLQVGDKVKALASTAQYYVNPILKLEPDSAETEYTESELPAVTIFTKKAVEIQPDPQPKYQRLDIYCTSYYGVALTNAAKVILAKFKK